MKMGLIFFNIGCIEGGVIKTKAAFLSPKSKSPNLTDFVSTQLLVPDSKWFMCIKQLRAQQYCQTCYLIALLVCIWQVVEKCNHIHSSQLQLMAMTAADGDDNNDNDDGN